MYVFLILFLIFLYILFNKEYFSDNNIILNKEQLINILINNNDKYYERFNHMDLKVRNIKSINEYKKNIVNSPVNITEHEKKIILRSINQINHIFENYSYDNFFIGKKANNIEWSIGIIDGKIYEEGFPHTRGNVIIIPKNLIYQQNLTKTLIHEKIHIYQKYYQDELKLYMNSNFKKSIHSSRITNNRANPDIDIDLYTDKDNNLMYCTYINNPKSIMDVVYYPINKPMYEHPYELMAYNIEQDISEKYNI
jgi:hypothetical protein